jgi:hypothetical protein
MASSSDRNKADPDLQRALAELEPLGQKSPLLPPLPPLGSNWMQFPLWVLFKQYASESELEEFRDIFDFWNFGGVQETLSNGLPFNIPWSTAEEPRELSISPSLPLSNFEVESLGSESLTPIAHDADRSSFTEARSEDPEQTSDQDSDRITSKADLAQGIDSVPPSLDDPVLPSNTHGHESAPQSPIEPDAPLTAPPTVATDSRLNARLGNAPLGFWGAETSGLQPLADLTAAEAEETDAEAIPADSAITEPSAESWAGETVEGGPVAPEEHEPEEQLYERQLALDETPVAQNALSEADPTIDGLDNAARSEPYPANLVESPLPAELAIDAFREDRSAESYAADPAATFSPPDASRPSFEPVDADCQAPTRLPETLPGTVGNSVLESPLAETSNVLTSENLLPDERVLGNDVPPDADLDDTVSDPAVIAQPADKVVQADASVAETLTEPQKLFEKSHSSLHSPPSPPILGDSDPQSPPELGSHFRGRVPRLEESGADLGLDVSAQPNGGECNVFTTFQTASQETLTSEETPEFSESLAQGSISAQELRTGAYASGDLQLQPDQSEPDQLDFAIEGAEPNQERFSSSERIDRGGNEPAASAAEISNDSQQTTPEANRELSAEVLSADVSNFEPTVLLEAPDSSGDIQSQETIADSRRSLSAEFNFDSTSAAESSSLEIGLEVEDSDAAEEVIQVQASQETEGLAQRSLPDDEPTQLVRQDDISSPPFAEPPALSADESTQLIVSDGISDLTIDDSSRAEATLERDNSFYNADIEAVSLEQSNLERSTNLERSDVQQFDVDRSDSEPSSNLELNSEPSNISTDIEPAQIEANAASEASDAAELQVDSSVDLPPDSDADAFELLSPVTFLQEIDRTQTTAFFKRQEAESPPTKVQSDVSFGEPSAPISLTQSDLSQTDLNQSNAAPEDSLQSTHAIASESQDESQNEPHVDRLSDALESATSIAESPSEQPESEAEKSSGWLRRGVDWLKSKFGVNAETEAIQNSTNDSEDSLSESAEELPSSIQSDPIKANFSERESQGDLESVVANAERSDSEALSDRQTDSSELVSPDGFKQLDAFDASERTALELPHENIESIDSSVTGEEQQQAIASRIKEQEKFSSGQLSEYPLSEPESILSQFPSPTEGEQISSENRMPQADRFLETPPTSSLPSDVAPRQDIAGSSVNSGDPSISINGATDQDRSQPSSFEVERSIIWFQPPASEETPVSDGLLNTQSEQVVPQTASPDATNTDDSASEIANRLGDVNRLNADDRTVLEVGNGANEFDRSSNQSAQNIRPSEPLETSAVPSTEGDVANEPDAISAALQSNLETVDTSVNEFDPRINTNVLEEGVPNQAGSATTDRDLVQPQDFNALNILPDRPTDAIADEAIPISESVDRNILKELPEEVSEDFIRSSNAASTTELNETSKTFDTSFSSVESNLSAPVSASDESARLASESLDSGNSEQELTSSFDHLIDPVSNNNGLDEQAQSEQAHSEQINFEAEATETKTQIDVSQPFSVQSANAPAEGVTEQPEGLEVSPVDEASLPNTGAESLEVSSDQFDENSSPATANDAPQTPWNRQSGNVFDPSSDERPVRSEVEHQDTTQLQHPSDSPDTSISAIAGEESQGNRFSEPVEHTVLQSAPEEENRDSVQDVLSESNQSLQTSSQDLEKAVSSLLSPDTPLDIAQSERDVSISSTQRPGADNVASENSAQDAVSGEPSTLLQAENSANAIAIEQSQSSVEEHTTLQVSTDDNNFDAESTALADSSSTAPPQSDREEEISNFTQTPVSSQEDSSVGNRDETSAGQQPIIAEEVFPEDVETEDSNAALIPVNIAPQSPPLRREETTTLQYSSPDSPEYLVAEAEGEDTPDLASAQTANTSAFEAIPSEADRNPNTLDASGSLPILAEPILDPATDDSEPHGLSEEELASAIIVEQNQSSEPIESTILQVSSETDNSNSSSVISSSLNESDSNQFLKTSSRETSVSRDEAINNAPQTFSSQNGDPDWGIDNEAGQSSNLPNASANEHNPDRFEPSNFLQNSESFVEPAIPDENSTLQQENTTLQTGSEPSITKTSSSTLAEQSRDLESQQYSADFSSNAEQSANSLDVPTNGEDRLDPSNSLPNSGTLDESSRDSTVLDERTILQTAPEPLVSELVTPNSAEQPSERDPQQYLTNEDFEQRVQEPSIAPTPQTSSSNDEPSQPSSSATVTRGRFSHNDSESLSETDVSSSPSQQEDIGLDSDRFTPQVVSPAEFYTDSYRQPPEETAPSTLAPEALDTFLLDPSSIRRTEANPESLSSNDDRNVEWQNDRQLADRDLSSEENKADSRQIQENTFLQTVPTEESVPDVNQINIQSDASTGQTNSIESKDPVDTSNAAEAEIGASSIVPEDDAIAPEDTEDHEANHPATPLKSPTDTFLLDPSFALPKDESSEFPPPNRANNSGLRTDNQSSEWDKGSDFPVEERTTLQTTPVEESASDIERTNLQSDSSNEQTNFVESRESTESVSASESLPSASQQDPINAQSAFSRQENSTDSPRMDYRSNADLENVGDRAIPSSQDADERPSNDLTPPFSDSTESFEQDSAQLNVTPQRTPAEAVSDSINTVFEGRDSSDIEPVPIEERTSVQETSTSANEVDSPEVTSHSEIALPSQSFIHEQHESAPESQNQPEPITVEDSQPQDFVAESSAQSPLPKSPPSSDGFASEGFSERLPAPQTSEPSESEEPEETVTVRQVDAEANTENLDPASFTPSFPSTNSTLENSGFTPAEDFESASVSPPIEERTVLQPLSSTPAEDDIGEPLNQETVESNRSSLNKESASENQKHPDFVANPAESNRHPNEFNVSRSLSVSDEATSDQAAVESEPQNSSGAEQTSAIANEHHQSAEPIENTVLQVLSEGDSGNQPSESVENIIPQVSSEGGNNNSTFAVSSNLVSSNLSETGQGNDLPRDLPQSAVSEVGLEPLSPDKNDSTSVEEVDGFTQNPEIYHSDDSSPQPVFLNEQHADSIAQAPVSDDPRIPGEPQEPNSASTQSISEFIPPMLGQEQQNAAEFVAPAATESISNQPPEAISALDYETSPRTNNKPQQDPNRASAISLPTEQPSESTVLQPVPDAMSEDRIDSQVNPQASAQPYSNEARSLNASTAQEPVEAIADTQNLQPQQDSLTEKGWSTEGDSIQSSESLDASLPAWTRDPDAPPTWNIDSPQDSTTATSIPAQPYNSDSPSVSQSVNTHDFGNSNQENPGQSASTASNDASFAANDSSSANDPLSGRSGQNASQRSISQPSASQSGASQPSKSQSETYTNSFSTRSRSSVAAPDSWSSLEDLISLGQSSVTQSSSSFVSSLLQAGSSLTAQALIDRPLMNSPEDFFEDPQAYSMSERQSTPVAEGWETLSDLINNIKLPRTDALEPELEDVVDQLDKALPAVDRTRVYEKIQIQSAKVESIDPQRSQVLRQDLYERVQNQYEIERERQGNAFTNPPSFDLYSIDSEPGFNPTFFTEERSPTVLSAHFHDAVQAADRNLRTEDAWEVFQQMQNARELERERLGIYFWENRSTRSDTGF